MRSHIHEAFDDVKWGRYGRGRRIGTGKESRGRRSVIVRDSARKGCVGRVIVDVRCRVRMMARDVKQWIRRWLRHNLVIIGSGESCWSDIGNLMQSVVNVANRSQDIPRHHLTVVILCSEDDLIPKGTELVLQFR